MYIVDSSNSSIVVCVSGASLSGHRNIAALVIDRLREYGVTCEYRALYHSAALLVAKNNKVPLDRVYEEPYLSELYSLRESMKHVYGGDVFVRNLEAYRHLIAMNSKGNCRVIVTDDCKDDGRFYTNDFAVCDYIIHIKNKNIIRDKRFKSKYDNVPLVDVEDAIVHWIDHTDKSALDVIAEIEPIIEEIANITYSLGGNNGIQGN